MDATSSRLTLVSPLQGWCAALEEAPDPVFAGRMLGDGVAIDPTGNSLYAPCAGTLITVPASKHALTLQAENGIQVLLHIGIDTVALAGEGFELHVRAGQPVRAGERLITFDLDLLARKARSLLTPVILTGGTDIVVSRRCVGRRVEVGEFLMEATGAPSAVITAGSASSALEDSVVVQSEHGIHARPAALLAEAIRKLSAEVSIAVRGRTANARSPIALMSLGIRHGERIAIRASGADSAAALAAVKRTLEARLPEAARSTISAAGSDPPQKAPAEGAAPEQRAREVTGVIASPGVAVGYAYQLARIDLEVAETAPDAARERFALENARAAVRTELQRTLDREQGAPRTIAEAHLGLLEDPELLERAAKLISLGKSAGFAWRAALREAAEGLRGLEDSRLRERADDLLDLESRVLSMLSGSAAASPELPADSILMGDELLPSQLVALDAHRLAGICVARGGPTSHVSLMAMAMGVPMLVAAGHRILQVATGTAVLLDAESGRLHIGLAEQEIEAARRRIAGQRARHAAALAAAQAESHTADGVRIEVFANIGSTLDAQLALQNGAEGCGLLRTEFLFLERQSAPDVREQAAQYQEIAQALGGRPLTIRTLDIGGDKPIPYLPLPREDNPALGLRGIRTSLWQPELLRQQLQAVLQVRAAGRCRILLPMITDPAEIRAVRTMLLELTGSSGPSVPIAVGAMIETPASAVMADWIAREADFLSIGTNDLTQYTLAIDRGQADLAARLDGLHPAVLRLIAKTTEAARKHARPVAVCGGLASDPAAVPLLIGLGIHELSMVAGVIPSMKARIARLRSDECASLAARALEQETPQAVRALMQEWAP